MASRRSWIIGSVAAVGAVLALTFALLNPGDESALRVLLARLGIMPLIHGTRTPSPRTQVINNFKQIVLAMHNYADVHGSLPPPAIYDAGGKPLLSWRVALLPYLESENLYKKFRLNEPWDSPHNAALLPEMPSLFNSFLEPQAEKPQTTTYRVFVGPGAAFEGRRGVSLKHFADGTSHTLLVVEAAQAVPWTQPAELAYAPEGSLPPLGNRFKDIFIAGFADCSVMSLPRNITDEKLRAAITRSGGEEVKIE
jgi:hypothetical protein